MGRIRLNQNEAFEDNVSDLAFTMLYKIKYAKSSVFDHFR